MNHSKNKYENGSADKITLSGDSQNYDNGSNNRKGNGFGRELNGVASGQVELTNLNPSGFLEEAVFKIPHILEMIMAHLDSKAMFNSSRVSPQWKSCAWGKLQNLVNIRFVNCPKEPNTFVLEAHSERSMQNFIAFVNDCAQFPATSYSFSEKKRGAPTSENLSAIHFFNAHGHLIKKLCLVDHMILFTDLWLLISSQATNLQHLELFHVHGFKINNFEETNKRLDILFNKGKSFEEQCKEIKLILDETLCQAKPIFKHLKVFKCFFLINDVALLRVLDCAPNLVEVFVPPKNLHVLLKPTNRLDVVKDFVFKIQLSNILKIKSLKEVVNHRKKKLVFQKLCLDSHFGVYSSETGTIIKELLDSCSAFLKNLEWINISERFPALQLPQVKCLSIGYLHYNLRLGQRTRVPIGVSLGQTFPNLKNLIIHQTIVAATQMNKMSIKDFFPDQIPLFSVTSVTVYFTPSKVLFQEFRKMFPNAYINVK